MIDVNPRIDPASRLIRTSPRMVYGAFSDPNAMELWLPPDGMIGRMIHFNFQEGGSYRMRLVFPELEQSLGKTSEDADEFEVRFIKLEDACRIEQEVTFESEDPSYSGVMRMVWTLSPQNGGTLVTIQAENVPVGIRQEDHAAGLNSSLEKLAKLV